MTAVPSSRPKLFSVALELTRYCNQHCDYCYNAWRGDPQADGAVDDRWPKRIARLLEAFEIDHFTLTGGEPFAYRGVFDLLGQLNEAGARFQFISNGGLFDDALAAKLAGYRPLSVQVTLNGDTLELHEAHVGKDHFERTLAGIRALRRAGVQVVGCIVITKKTAHAVGRILELWRSLDVKQIALSRFSPAGYAAEHAAQLLPTRDEITRAFELAQPFAEQGMRLNSTMPIPPCAVEVERFAGIRFGSCAVGTSMQELAVGPNGHIRHCTLHQNDLGATDIADPSVDLPGIWAHKERLEYRASTPEFCRGCLYEQSCGGGCGAAAQWVLGSRQRPDPFVAQHVDDGFARNLARRRNGKTYLEIHP